MNEYTGSILELYDKQAIVMTEACDFVSIHRQPQMFVGQQVKFKKSELYKTNKNHLKYFALAASLFIVVLCSVFYFQIFLPNTVFAYIDVDINPSLELVINKNAKVIDIKPLNNDAQVLIKDLKLNALPVNDAISEIVKTSKQIGFISTSKTNAVLISASINEESNYNQNVSKQKTLDRILSDIDDLTFNVGTENIKPEILKITPENRKSSIKNNMSMGRYALYSIIKDKNNEMTVDKAKTERVSDMLDKVKIKGYNKKSDSKNINPKKPNSNNNESKDTNIKSKDSNINNTNNVNSDIAVLKNNKSDHNIKDDLKISKNKEKDKSNSSDKEELPTKSDKSESKTLHNDKADNKSNKKSKELDSTKGNGDTNKNNVKKNDAPVKKSK